MSSRKAAAIWGCTLVIFATVSLAGGIGIGGSAAAVNAEFEVTNASLAEPEIVEGETATITADVENVGTETGTFTAKLQKDGDTVLNRTDIEIRPDNPREIKFVHPFNSSGTYDLSVNSKRAGTLNVTEPPSAVFEVSSAQLRNGTILVGDTAVVSANVSNVGDAEGTFTAEFRATKQGGTTETVDTQSVTLASGKSERVDLRGSFEQPGKYEVQVNQTKVGILTVESPADLAVTNATLEEEMVSEGGAVTVNVTIENSGDREGSLSVEVAADEEVTLTETVTVGPRERSTEQFTYTAPAQGEYEITVNSVDAGMLMVYQPANVSIRNTSLVSETITAGESATVTVELVNDGDVDGEFTTELRDGNTTLESDTRTVGSDASETVRFNQTFDAAGEYELTVNNDPVGTLAVLEPADVSLGATTVAPESVEINESVQLTIELRNDGEATGQRDIDVALGDGTTVQRTPDVPANGTTLTISHAYTAAGEYTVTVDEATVANVTVVDPQNNVGGGGGGGSSGSSGSSGSAPTGGPEPTVVRSESNEGVTVSVTGATGERYEIAVELAGPSDSQPAVSVSSVGVDPAGDPEAYETTIGRPTADPTGRDPVPHGVALGYLEFNSSLGAASTSAATLQFTVDEETIPRGLGQADVAVMRYTDGEWTTANVTHTVEGATHSVTLPHAAPVAVVALEPGRVNIVESEVPADRVRAGYETTLRTTVENPGDRTATRTLTVSMHGETVTEREVTLGPGENRTVEISFQPPESGPVSLEGSEVGAITLFGDDGGDATSPGAETDESAPGFGVIATVLALLVTALVVRRRR
jgi:PGF-CTERM protein